MNLLKGVLWFGAVIAFWVAIAYVLLALGTMSWSLEGL